MMPVSSFNERPAPYLMRPGIRGATDSLNCPSMLPLSYLLHGAPSSYCHRPGTPSSILRRLILSYFMARCNTFGQARCDTFSQTVRCGNNWWTECWHDFFAASCKASFGGRARDQHRELNGRFPPNNNIYQQPEFHALNKLLMIIPTSCTHIMRNGHINIRHIADHSSSAKRVTPVVHAATQEYRKCVSVNDLL